MESTSVINEEAKTNEPSREKNNNFVGRSNSLFNNGVLINELRPNSTRAISIDNDEKRYLTSHSLFDEEIMSNMNSFDDRRHNIKFASVSGHQADQNPAIRKYLGLTLDDLEWDKNNDFVYMPESETMSILDLNELVSKLKLLDFDMALSSNASDMQRLNSETGSQQGLMRIMSLVNFDSTSSDKRKTSMDDDDNDDDADLKLSYTERMREKRKRNLTNVSQASSNQSRNIYDLDTYSNGFYTPSDCLTREDLFRIKYLALQQKLLKSPSIANGGLSRHESFALSNGLSMPPIYAPITYDVESLYAALTSRGDDGVNMNDFSDQDAKTDLDSMTQQETTNDASDPMTNSTTTTTTTTYYHSMPDLRLFNSKLMSIRNEDDALTSFKRIQLKSKHMSLLDINSFEWIYLTSKAAGESLVRKQRKNRNNLNLNLSNVYTPNFETRRKSLTNATESERRHVEFAPIEAEKIEPAPSNKSNEPRRLSKVSLNGSSVNFSRMGRLASIRSYMSRIGERLKHVILNAILARESSVQGSSSSSASAIGNTGGFSNSSNNKILYPINEEVVCSYEIIEKDDILRTPTMLDARTDADAEEVFQVVDKTCPDGVKLAKLKDLRQMRIEELKKANSNKLGDKIRYSSLRDDYDYEQTALVPHRRRMSTSANHFFSETSLSANSASQTNAQQEQHTTAIPCRADTITTTTTTTASSDSPIVKDKRPSSPTFY